MPTTPHCNNQNDIDNNGDDPSKKKLIDLINFYHNDLSNLLDPKNLSFKDNQVIDQFVSELVIQLSQHKRLYYQGNPQITDQTYDLAEEILGKLAPDHFFLSSVGYDDQGRAFHHIPLLSLEKTREYEKLHSWFTKPDDFYNLLSLKKNQKSSDNFSKKSINSIKISASFKLDGMAVSCVYYNGYLWLAKTRGNGRKGEDITGKVKFIDSIRKKIDWSKITKKIQK